MLKSLFFFSNFLEWHKISVITHRDNIEIRFQKGKRFSVSNEILITNKNAFSRMQTTRLQKVYAT